MGNKFDAEDECVEELRKRRRWNLMEMGMRWMIVSDVEHGVDSAYGVAVDDMEEPGMRIRRMRTKWKRRREAEEEHEVPDDGVDVGASGGEALPPVSDEQADE